MSNVWDELPADSDDYVKFEKVGDGVDGTITSIGLKTWDDGSVCPVLGIQCADGTDRTWTVGQVRAKAQLRETRPNVGDHIKASLTHIEKRGGGKTLKHIDVVTTPGGAPTHAPVEPVATKVHHATAGGDPIAAHPQGAALRGAGVPDDVIKQTLGLS